jgi:Predicted transcriptional regulator
MRLTNAEEQVMKYLWKLERAYMKNIIDEYPEPKPAATTVATLLRRMIEKKFIGYNQHGSNREYYPLIKMTDYCTNNLRGMIKDFFNDSSSQFASFFTSETNLTEKELNELKKIVDQQIKLKKK